MSESDREELTRTVAEVYEDFFVPAVLQEWVNRVIEAASGKSKRVVFRRACDRESRQIAQQWAHCSLSKPVWAAAYWQQSRSRCAGEHDAYRRLANRWLAVLWKLWQTRVPYDEAYHLQLGRLRSQPS